MLSRGASITLGHDSKLVLVWISKQPELLRLLKTSSSRKELTHQWAVSFVPVPSAVTGCWQGRFPPGLCRPHGFLPIPTTGGVRHVSGGSQTPQTPSKATAAVPQTAQRCSWICPLLLCPGFAQTQVRPHQAAGIRAEAKDPQQQLQGSGWSPCS